MQTRSSTGGLAVACLLASAFVGSAFASQFLPTQTREMLFVVIPGSLAWMLPSAWVFPVVYRDGSFRLRFNTSGLTSVLGCALMFEVAGLYEFLYQWHMIVESRLILIFGILAFVLIWIGTNAQRSLHSERNKKTALR